MNKHIIEIDDMYRNALSGATSATSVNDMIESFENYCNYLDNYTSDDDRVLRHLKYRKFVANNYLNKLTHGSRYNQLCHILECDYYQYMNLYNAILTTIKNKISMCSDANAGKKIHIAIDVCCETLNMDSDDVIININYEPSFTKSLFEAILHKLKTL